MFKDRSGDKNPVGRILVERFLHPVCGFSGFMGEWNGFRFQIFQGSLDP